jgi:hypothetical protein
VKRKVPEEKKPTRLQRLAATLIKRITGMDTSSVDISSVRTPTSNTLFGQEIMNVQDYVFGAKREPAVYRISFMVANDCWDNWFKIKNKTDEKDSDFEKHILQKLNDLDARKKLTLLTTFERLFGWAVLVLRYSDYGGDLSKQVQSPVEISELQAYSELHVTSVEEDKKLDSERIGLPEWYSFGSTVNPIRIHFSRTIHLATRIFDHPWKGISAVGVVYDDIMALRYIRWNVALAMIRYGSGFPDITIDDATGPQIDAFIASGQFDNLNAKKYFVHNQTKKLEFKGVGAQAFNPGNYLQPSLESMSGGTGIPEPVFRGAQAGALTGSEVNERAYFKMVSDVQTAHEPLLRDLINRIAALEYGENGIPDYEIVWNPGFEADERTKAEIELLKSQTAEKMLAYMTPDEVRSKLYQLNALPNGEGIMLKKIQPAQNPLDQQFYKEKNLMDQAPNEVEKDLAASLKRIIGECVSGRMPPEDGVLGAKLVIEEYVQRMKQVTLLNVRSLAGKPISQLSPERERQYAMMAAEYLDSFKRILADAMKGKTS